MRNTSIRKNLLENLRARTIDLQQNDLNGLCAQDAAVSMNASRNLLSQYLNEFVADGTAAKVNTRPVYYFCRKMNAFTLSQAVYNSFDELKKEVERETAGESPGNHNASLHTLIGAEGSLARCVEQCKAAVTYPDNGLPILLQGPSGTGKTLIARLMYEYGIEKKLIPSEKRFVHVNCSEYADNPELFLTNLFGYRKGAYTGADQTHEGLLALADGGVLFLDEVHCLKSECQEKLFQFMDRETYHMVGDNDTWYTSRVRLILATTENPENALLRTLLRRIPITVRLPSLPERPTWEKKELIRSALLDEETRIGRPVGISALALESLMMHIFPGNAGELLNGIKASLARAFLHSKDEFPGNPEEVVVIHFSDLPHDIIQDAAASIRPDKYDDRKVFSPKDLCTAEQPKNGLYNLHRKLLFHGNHKSKNDADAFLTACLTSVGQYLDRLYYGERSISNHKKMVTAALVSNIYDIVAQKYGLEQPSGQETDALARFLCDRIACRFSKEEIEALVKTGKELHRTWPEGWRLASELAALFQDTIGRGFGIPAGNPADGIENDLLTMDLFLLLRYFHRELPEKQIPCIIAAHGLSTASSMAQAVNHLLGCPLFDAIDMPVECSPSRVIAELSSRLRRLKHHSEAVILVDMGSLEDLATELQILEGFSVGIVNNVTTRLALEIGASLMDGGTMENVLKLACEHNTFTWTCVNNRRHRNVILSVCSTGIATAGKIAELITQSLPANAEITVEALDYTTLHEQGRGAPVFTRDRVLFIIGTLNPQVPDILFVPIEDIIARKGRIRLGTLLSEYLTPEETASFDRQLLRNFSLMNLLDHLTILNPEKVVGHVEKIIGDLQQELGKTFPGGMVVGLYLHIGCLVERLITDHYISQYPNEATFERRYGDFIRIVRRCFGELEKSYGVKIPISEIGYLHEYISYLLEESVSKKTDSVQNKIDSASPAFDQTL